MRFDNAFDVQAPVGQVWTAMLDVERVAPCVPGAEVLEQVSPSSYRVAIKIRIGPIVQQYRGEIEVVESDESTHHAVMKARARETRGQGRAEATVDLRLTGEGTGTHGDMTADVALSGPAAAMGRGIIQDVSARIVEDFSKNLAAMLASGPAAATAEAPTFAGTTAAPAEEGRWSAAAETAQHPRVTPTPGLPPTAQPRVEEPASGGAPPVERPSGEPPPEEPPPSGEPPPEEPPPSGGPPPEAPPSGEPPPSAGPLPEAVPELHTPGVPATTEPLAEALAPEPPTPEPTTSEAPTPVEPPPVDPPPVRPLPEVAAPDAPTAELPIPTGPPDTAPSPRSGIMGGPSAGPAEEAALGAPAAEEASAGPAAAAATGGPSAEATAREPEPPPVAPPPRPEPAPTDTEAAPGDTEAALPVLSILGDVALKRLREPRVIASLMAALIVLVILRSRRGRP